MVTIIFGTVDYRGLPSLPLPLAWLITLTSTLILDITKIKPHPIIVFNYFLFLTSSKSESLFFARSSSSTFGQVVMISRSGPAHVIPQPSRVRILFW